MYVHWEWNLSQRHTDPFYFLSLLPVCIYISIQYILTNLMSMRFSATEPLICLFTVYINVIFKYCLHQPGGFSSPCVWQTDPPWWGGSIRICSTGKTQSCRPEKWNKSLVWMIMWPTHPPPHPFLFLELWGLSLKVVYVCFQYNLDH